jgi:hypothetical protein
MTTKGFIKGQANKYDVDAAVLHFSKETHPNGMSVTRQAMQVKATETAKSPGITNFVVQQGWRDKSMRGEGLLLMH